MRMAMRIVNNKGEEGSLLVALEAIKHAGSQC